MNSGVMVVRGLTHYRRVHFAVALGIMAATAVLTGALLVGDSVRGSLRDLTLDRLGKIDQLLITDRFFSVDMVRRLESGEHFSAQFISATPAILLPQGTLEAPHGAGDARLAGRGTERASGILVIGAEAGFWQLQPDDQPAPATLPGEGEIVLNAPLADELRVRVGDTVVLRIPKANQVPADSALGRKTDTTRSLTELKVVEIIPARGLGRFSLHPSQHLPRNAFLSLGTLQEALNVPARANAILVQQRDFAESSTLDRLLRPTLDDLGLKITHVRRTYQDGEGPEKTEQVAFEYFQLSSDRLLLDDAVVDAALQAWSEFPVQPVYTYLANSIRRIDEAAGATPPSGSSANPTLRAASPRAEVPYSTVCGIDSFAKLGPLVDAKGEPLAVLADDEIVLNRWTADALGVEVHDKIRLTFFEPETTHGETVERSAEFRVRAIAPLVEPVEGFRLGEPARFLERPALTNDSDLTPTVAGITDQESISKWDPPFPYDSRRVKPADDEYWANHRTTPKAFVSLATAQRLWHSRFGRHTSLRVPAGQGVSEQILARSLQAVLRSEGAAPGLEFQAIKAQSLAASAGTTPFDALFLSLSFFLIAAAILLVALLFRLGIEQRANEIGVLLATGWTPDAVARQLATEGMVVAAIGSSLGLLAGIGYAWLLIVGLKTWWLGAVTTPFLELHVSLRSLAIGLMSGLAVGAMVINLSLRQTRSMAVRQLLAGQFTVALAKPTARGKLYRWFAPLAGRGTVAVLFIAAVLLAGIATQLGGEAQAGSFVGSGLAVLSGLLLLIHLVLRSGGLASSDSSRRRPIPHLLALAGRNAARNPGRSTVTIGLVGVAVFMIVALSAFRLAPTESGTGGFDLIAESSQSILQDLMSDEVQDDLFAGDAATLEGTTLFAFRLRPGDDASCTNLYQARQPRVLGVPRRLVEHFDQATTSGFAWAGSAAQQELEQANPWRLLTATSSPSASSDEEPPIPVVLDKNTALYSLHLYGGIGQEFSIRYDEVGEVRFRVAGLLANSVLQGSLLIDEEAFKRRFPRINGYRFFLMQSEAGQSDAVAALLEDRLSDQGFDVRRSRDVLADFLAVQNTYLSTFQSLGALGLLLGTFGLATVQVRSVVERRGELALLRATGFRRRRLANLVLGEHLVLLLGGMATGLIGAFVAVLPHLLVGGATIPWLELGPLLGIVLVVGIGSGLVAVRAALSAPLLVALRGD